MKIFIPRRNIWTPKGKWQSDWIKDLFPWMQDPLDLHAVVGGPQFSVSSFPYGNTAAAGVGGAGATVLLDALTNVSNEDNPIASVILEVERSGDYVVDGSTQSNEWVAFGDKTSTIGDDYEAYLTKTSGALANPNGPAVDTWHTISTDRIWQWTSSVSFPRVWLGTLDVREIANTSNSDQTSITVTLEVLGGGGILL